MKRPWQKRIVLSIGSMILWFVAVDQSWFVHDCPDCGHGEDSSVYRLFTIPIHQSTCEYPSVAQQVAQDLGIPCTHPDMVTWHKHRRWGLIYCSRPCVNGLHRLVDETSWYGPSHSAKVKTLAQANPDVKAEYRERVFNHHDFGFLGTVLDRAGIETPLQKTADSESQSGR